MYIILFLNATKNHVASCSGILGGIKELWCIGASRKFEGMFFKYRQYSFLLVESKNMWWKVLLIKGN